MNSIKTFNKAFGLIGITIGNPTTMVITSTTPHEVSMMPNGSFSMRCSIDDSKQESYWVLYLWKWSIRLTKTKIETWNSHSFMADITTSYKDIQPIVPNTREIYKGKFTLTDHDIKDIFKTFGDL